MRAGNAQRVLGQRFDGEPVGVPAEAAFHVIAPHGLVTGDHILDGPGQQVAVVGQPRGEGGAVVEDVFPAAFALREGFGENLLLFPEFEDLLLEFGKIHLIGNILESHVNAPLTPGNNA